MAEAKKQLVLLLYVADIGADPREVHDMAEVSIPIRPGVEEKDILDALQRSVCNAFDALKRMKRV